MNDATEFDLEPFVVAQEREFAIALSEIKAGQCREFWPSYIFPQLSGVVFNCLDEPFGIPNLEAARAYMNHPYLRNNLITITQALMDLEDPNPYRIMMFPRYRILHSSLTLFELAVPDEPLFGAAIDKLFNGKRHGATLDLLSR